MSPDGKPFSPPTHNSFKVVNHLMFSFLVWGIFVVVVVVYPARQCAVTEEHSKEEQGESGTAAQDIRIRKNLWKYPNLSLRPKKVIDEGSVSNTP